MSTRFCIFPKVIISLRLPRSMTVPCVAHSTREQRFASQQLRQSILYILGGEEESIEMSDSKTSKRKHPWSSDTHTRPAHIIS